MNKIKSKVVPKPDHFNLAKLIDKYFEFGFSKYAFYSHSIDHCIARRKPSFRRRVIYHSISAHIFLASLINGLIAVHPNRHDIKNLGPPYFAMSIKEEKERIMLAMQAFLSLIVFLARLLEYHLESSFQLFSLEFIYSLRNNKQAFKLNKTNQNKFNVLFYTLFYMFTRGVTIMYGYSLYAFHTVLFVYAYLISDHHLDKRMMMVNLAIFVLWVKTALDSIVTYIPIIVMTIKFVCYKFDEIQRSLAKAVRRRNRMRILTHIRLHSRLTKLCNRFSNVNNIALGLVHMIMPYTAVLSVQCFKYEARTDFDKIIKVLFVFDSIVLNSSALLINQSSASISVQNRLVPKLCYRIFLPSTQCTYDLRFLLKVEEFIARLNKEFIGYRCFNLFKFTKIRLYEYILSIGLTYILVVGFINKF